MTSNRGVLGNKLDIFFTPRLKFCFMKSVVILAKRLCASITLSVFPFCLRKMKVSENFTMNTLLFLLISSGLGLCVTEISRTKTEGEEI